MWATPDTRKPPHGPDIRNETIILTTFSRRAFLQASVLSATPLLAAARQSGPATAAGPTPSAARRAAAQPQNGAALNWLEGAPALSQGVTLGVPWPQGKIPKDQAFSLSDGAGSGAAGIPVQSWPLAYWPDGSLKWTAHALPAGAGLSGQLALAPAKGKPAALSGPSVSVQEGAAEVAVSTGVISCRIPRRGAHLIHSIKRAGRDIARNGKLVALSDDQPDGGSGATRHAAFESDVRTVTVEQRGPVRAVVKIDGMHRSGQRAWLPFSVRLYFYAGAESVRIMHTFVFDGDEHKEFIRGIGLRFNVPMHDPLHDRHVRFAGEEKGLWAEAVRGLTGLRRDPGAAFRAAQVAGLACPPLDAMAPNVRKLMHLIPAWGDYTLSQLSADGFQIRKRTKPGHGWIDAAWGRRAPGAGYIGGASGGVAFGLRDFWQRHPTQLDIRSAHTDEAEVTLWMWSPDAQAMDMRFYHDGMGMETHADELDGLEITYEDYEKGYGSPHGVARSSEITLWALAATPSREAMTAIAQAVQSPPQLVAQPAHYPVSYTHLTLPTIYSV